MRSTGFVVRWLMLLVAVLAADGGSARAQDTAAMAQRGSEQLRAPLGDALVGQAALDYQAALLLFDDADYAGASIKFKRAFEQSNDARLLWNLAVCEKNLRHYAAVLPLLERYQRLEPALSADDRQEVAAVLATVRMLVSRVRVRATQPDISVFVDAELRGTTPLMEPLWVDLGKRSFRFSKPGFQERVIVQEVAGGSEATLEVTLHETARTGQLHVIGQAGDSVHIDGKLAGEREWLGALPPGEHMVRVTREGMHQYENEVDVVAGDVRTLYVSLEPARTGLPTWVWVGAGALAVGGLATSGYFLLRPAPHADAVAGTLDTQYVR